MPILTIDSQGRVTVFSSPSNRKRFDAQYTPGGRDKIEKIKEAYMRHDYDEVNTLSLELELIQLDCKCVAFRASH